MVLVVVAVIAIVVVVGVVVVEEEVVEWRSANRLDFNDMIWCDISMLLYAISML